MKIRKLGGIRAFALALSFFACANLLIPEVLRAEMMKSRLQTEQNMAMIREKLGSPEIWREIRKFGLSESEALRIREFVTDDDVVKSLALLESEAITDGNTVRIGQKSVERLISASERSASKHLDENLRNKLSARAEKLIASESDNHLIASELSIDESGKSAEIRLAEIRKAITSEKLVAMGMKETDAINMISELKDEDFKKMFQGNVRIGYGASIGGIHIIAFLILAAGLTFLCINNGVSVLVAIGIISLPAVIEGLIRLIGSYVMAK